MRRLYLRDCQPGDVLEDIYVITGKQFAATNTGKYFIKAFVSDRSQQLTARIWNATRDMFNAIPESGFVRLRGRVENYQNNLQLIIERLGDPSASDAFDLSDLIPQTEKDIDAMCQRLFALCGTIRNRHLAAIVQQFLDDEDLMNNFAKAPAAMSFHHAYIGGLLEHTLGSMEVADAVVRFYPLINRDLVITGIFLHDIAKTWELSYECSFGYTDAGHLVGHIVKAAMWVEEKSRQASRQLGEEIPRALIDVLEHIILSHHGTVEHGAVRPPCTPEAMVVHAIENLDAKLMMALTATRGPQQEGIDSNWTEYMKAFDGKLYRPDVAPGETEPENPQAQPAAQAAPAAATHPTMPRAARATPDAAAPGQSPARQPPAPAATKKSNGEHQPASAPMPRPPGPSASAPMPRPPGPSASTPVPRPSGSSASTPPATAPGAAKPTAITNPLFEGTPAKKR